MKTFFTVALSTMGTCVFCSVVYADNGANAAKPTELPKSGVLSSVSSGNRGETRAAPWGSEMGTGEGGQAPISGSVSRLDPKQWKAVVASSAERPYSVDVAVEQLGDRNNVVKSDSMSFTLKPGEIVNRTVTAHTSSTQARLVLRNWKKIGKDPQVKVTPTVAAAGRLTERTR